MANSAFPIEYRWPLTDKSALIYKDPSPLPSISINSRQQYNATHPLNSIGKTSQNYRNYKIFMPQVLSNGIGRHLQHLPSSKVPLSPINTLQWANSLPHWLRQKVLVIIWHTMHVGFFDDTDRCLSALPPCLLRTQLLHLSTLSDTREDKHFTCLPRVFCSGI